MSLVISAPQHKNQQYYSIKKHNTDKPMPVEQWGMWGGHGGMHAEEEADLKAEHLVGSVVCLFFSVFYLCFVLQY
jgi:hypothetical protein